MLSGLRGGRGDQGGSKKIKIKIPPNQHPKSKCYNIVICPKYGNIFNGVGRKGGQRGGEVEGMREGGREKLPSRTSAVNRDRESTEK